VKDLKDFFFLFLLEENKQIPTSLRKEAVALHKTLDWEDEGGEGKNYILLFCICFD
jgi:hypothetical protein